MKALGEKRTHLLFKIGIIIKGLDGVLELFAGLALLLTSQTAILNLVHRLTQAELIEDPHDFLANHLVNFFDHLSLDTKQFAAIYLLGHGIVKIGIVTGLLFERLWAFPVAIALQGLFIIYQVYRLAHSFSLGLMVLTVFDLIVLFLIWREAKYRKAASR